jgi:hypothetical protein
MNVANNHMANYREKDRKKKAAVAKGNKTFFLSKAV